MKERMIFSAKVIIGVITCPAVFMIMVVFLILEATVGRIVWLISGNNIFFLDLLYDSHNKIGIDGENMIFLYLGGAVPSVIIFLMAIGLI